MSGESIRCKTVTVTVQENGIIRHRPDGYLIGRLTDEIDFHSLAADATAPDAGDAEALACPHGRRPHDGYMCTECHVAAIAEARAGQPDAGDVEALAQWLYGEWMRQQGIEPNDWRDPSHVDHLFMRGMAERIGRLIAAREAQLRGALKALLGAQRVFQMGSEEMDRALSLARAQRRAEAAIANPSLAAQRVQAVIDAARLFAKASEDPSAPPMVLPKWAALALLGLRNALRALDGKDGASNA